MSVRVGVVIRTKDRPAFLSRALRDVARQTLSDWEIVIVNDGGDQAVVDDVVAASDLVDRVTLLDTVRPGGRCAAANAGLRALEADLVVLHDDDDLWESTFLETTVNWLDAHPRSAGVITACAIVYEELRGDEWVEQRRVPFWEGSDRVSLSEMLEINRAVPISFVYRRKVHEEIGWYNEQLDAVEDWEFLLRLLPGHDVGFIDGPPLALWTQRPTAYGADANSMYLFRDQHERDDGVVRDRELAEWIRTNGLGLPLYIAAVERRLSRQIEDAMMTQREWMRRELDAHQPVWSRLRRWRRRLRGER